MLLAAGAMPDEGIAVAWLTSLNVTDEDIRIFGHRDKIAKALITAHPDRYLAVDNIDIDVAATAAAIISAARQRSRGLPARARPKT
ncbi:hypothetical protein [Salinispora fenicalii]|uniref:hypothetical protein n=1 Tax=Salinispora fenicalii TaxID=1137263 RepID=UPI000480E202|nr:hypothetical protein [Salinispora fenicalii]